MMNDEFFLRSKKFKSLTIKYIHHSSFIIHHPAEPLCMFFFQQKMVFPGHWLRHGALLALCCVASLSAWAQNSPVPARDTTQKLKIETAEVVEGFSRNGREMRKLSGNVRMLQEKTYVYCDTAIIDDYTNNAVLKGNVVLEQGDSVRVFADSAVYIAAIKSSDLFGKVVLVNGKQQLFTKKLRYDMANKIATYHEGATMSNGKSQLKSRHGYYHVNDKEVYFKGEVLATDPEFTMRTDTMVYNTETEMVIFVAPTLISQQKSRIYTEGGFYDIENNFAEFDKNPQYEKEDQKGRARKMRYSGTTKEYTLEGEAEIQEPSKGRTTTAEVVRYNADTEDMVLRGDAHFRDSTRDIQGTEIRFNDRNKMFLLRGRGRVVDPPNIIEADSLDFNDQLGNGLAIGSVIWMDTASDYTILSHRMDYNKQTEYLNAFGSFGAKGAAGRPLMKSLVSGDTLFMSADTLTSFKPDTASDHRLLLAHRDVRIFKSDMQASCDSLSFSSVDSIFWLYKLDSLRLPILWSDTSQFSGDTIKLLLKNKKLDRIWLRKNAFVINSEDGLLFNQIKGRNTTAYFKGNDVREMLVEGNAQAIYYALDDKKAYIGLNETACSEMRLFFGNNQVESIKFYTEPTGKFIPMRKAGKDTKKLDGFFWEKTRRPGSVMDLE
jgi:lipopolysaccharide export system protein LptA